MFTENKSCYTVYGVCTSLVISLTWLFLVWSKRTDTKFSSGILLTVWPISFLGINNQSLGWIQSLTNLAPRSCFCLFFSSFSPFWLIDLKAHIGVSFRCLCRLAFLYRFARHCSGSLTFEASIRVKHVLLFEPEGSVDRITTLPFWGYLFRHFTGSAEEKVRRGKGCKTRFGWIS